MGKYVSIGTIERHRLTSLIQVCYKTTQCMKGNIEQILSNAAENLLVVRACEPCIRTFLFDWQGVTGSNSSTPITQIGELRDAVKGSDVQWCKCCITCASATTIAAASKEKRTISWQFCVYGFDVFGRIMFKCDSPGELLRDMCWHPKRSLFATCVSKTVQLWSYDVKEQWRGFVPPFEEIPENIVVEEDEDEFDLDPVISEVSASTDSDSLFSFLQTTGKYVSELRREAAEGDFEDRGEVDVVGIDQPSNAVPLGQLRDVLALFEEQYQTNIPRYTEPDG
jgi:hypothetical protein